MDCVWPLARDRDPGARGTRSSSGECRRPAPWRCGTESRAWIPPLPALAHVDFDLLSGQEAAVVRIGGDEILVHGVEKFRQGRIVAYSSAARLHSTATRPTRGSRASRKPSPRQLKPITATKMARPGKSDTWGASIRYARPSLTIFPHSGVGGCTPKPRKERIAARRIAVAICIDEKTSSGETELGRMWRKRTRGWEAPSAVAPWTNSSSLRERTMERASRA